MTYFSELLTAKSSLHAGNLLWIIHVGALGGLRRRLGFKSIRPVVNTALCDSMAHMSVPVASGRRSVNVLNRNHAEE